MPDLSLTPPLFAILSSLIEERLGLFYTLQDQELLAAKVSSRALEAGFDSILDYYYFLRYDDADGAEFEALVSALVVNETYFFREFEPLRVLVSHFIEPKVRSGTKPRIWSAACSTGEEPLTIAMLLAERGLLGQVELIATDVSKPALRKAQSGIHGRRSLRHVPCPELASTWLEVSGDRVLASAKLSSAIQWQHLNLVDRDAIRAIGRCDFIVCRNVLIYFQDARAARVVNDLAAQLRQNGLLLVGVSESLMRFGSELECEENGGSFFYRKASK